MTPADFRECLATLHWSQRGLADILNMDERQVRRWASGSPIPPAIATWLDLMARFHEMHQPPSATERRAES